MVIVPLGSPWEGLREDCRAPPTPPSPALPDPRVIFFRRFFRCCFNIDFIPFPTPKTSENGPPKPPKIDPKSAPTAAAKDVPKKIGFHTHVGPIFDSFSLLFNPLFRFIRNNFQVNPGKPRSQKIQKNTRFCVKNAMLEKLTPTQKTRTKCLRGRPNLSLTKIPKNFPIWDQFPPIFDPKAV